MSKFIRYQIFVSIVEHGSLAKAAEQLFSSPSTISKQLSKLEQELETKLIDRTTHTVAVTDTGRMFYQKAKDILNSVEEAEEIIKYQTKEPEGKLVVALPQALLKTPIFSLLKKFSERYPKIQYDFRISSSTENLVERRIHFAFRIGELKNSNLTTIPISKLELIFCASPGYIKKHGNIKLRELTKSGHLIIPNFISAPSMNKILNLSELGTTADKSQCHITNDAATIDELAIAGLGISPALDISIAQYIREGKLVRLFPSKKFPAPSLNLVYHRREYLPTNMRFFKDFVKKEFPKPLSQHRRISPAGPISRAN